MVASDLSSCTSMQPAGQHPHSPQCCVVLQHPVTEKWYMLIYLFHTIKGIKMIIKKEWVSDQKWTYMFLWFIIRLRWGCLWWGWTWLFPLSRGYHAQLRWSNWLNFRQRWVIHLWGVLKSLIFLFWSLSIQIGFYTGKVFTVWIRGEIMENLGSLAV